MSATIEPMPKFVPATVTELQRVQLLAGLPGEKLGEIAKHMEREEVPPGRAVVREGDDAKRFYVVLSGSVRGQPGRPRARGGCCGRATTSARSGWR